MTAAVSASVSASDSCPIDLDALPPDSHGSAVAVGLLAAAAALDAAGAATMSSCDKVRDLAIRSNDTGDACGQHGCGHPDRPEHCYIRALAAAYAQAANLAVAEAIDSLRAARVAHADLLRNYRHAPRPIRAWARSIRMVIPVTPLAARRTLAAARMHAASALEWADAAVKAAARHPDPDWDPDAFALRSLSRRSLRRADDLARRAQCGEY